MTDIAIAWDATNFRGDWAIAGGDLATGSDIESAVLISLFTDRISAPDYVPTDGTGNQRGWWADTYEPSPLGSRLWQLNRAVKSSSTAILNQARDYCREALQWLVDLGAVGSVEVQTTWLTATALGITVNVIQPSGSPLSFSYSWSWSGA